MHALPLTTEAPTLEALLERIVEIAPEIAVENGLAADGDKIVIHVIAERERSPRRNYAAVRLMT